MNSNKTTTVKEIMQERDYIIIQLMDELVMHEELLLQVINQSNAIEQKAFRRISAMIDITLNQIESSRAYYKREILRATKFMDDPIFEKEYSKLLNQICLN